MSESSCMFKMPSSYFLNTHPRWCPYPVVFGHETTPAPFIMTHPIGAAHEFQAFVFKLAPGGHHPPRICTGRPFDTYDGQARICAFGSASHNYGNRARTNRASEHWQQVSWAYSVFGELR